MPKVIEIKMNHDSSAFIEERTDEKILQEISLRFIREVKRVKGSDTAIEVINSLSDTLGKAWSSQIIFDILGQDVDDLLPYLRVTFRSGDMSQKINMIRTIRSATGLGLKEAKDVFESLYAEVQIHEMAQPLPHSAHIGNFPYMKVPVREADFKSISRDFKDCGAYIL